MPARISEHGIIGNLRTAALVSNRGGIDLLCAPDFDSPTVFGEILDPCAGHFRISPDPGSRPGTQLYLTDTAILLTRFYTGDAIVELMDFMVISDESEGLQIVRRIRQVAGHGTCNLEFAPKPGYGSQARELLYFDGGVRSAGPDLDLWLYSPLPLQLGDELATGTWSMNEGDELWFVLSDSQIPALNGSDTASFGMVAFERMYKWWTTWSAQCSYRGRWMELVSRSAITLKLLCYAPEGSIVAAPSFALPEDPGGERNWDYRYTWIRDASLSINALLKLGIYHEADAFLDWIMRCCLPHPLRLMYTIRGDEVPEERNLSDWEGYDGSRPVRIGNNACWQTQLDIYGELLDTVALYLDCRGFLPDGLWDLLLPHIDFVCRAWMEPDHGIWEVRGGKQEFLHSRLMCWVALDRALKIGELLQRDHPAADWKRIRAAIRESIEQEFWDAGKQSFVQYRGTTELDAALLLMPLCGFIDIDDPRWVSTIAAIERELKLDVLVYRYRAGETDTDGLHGGEGTFTLCSFWYISCLARAGKHREANGHFVRLIRYANPIGLFSEQIGSEGAQLGNFPQAFTHLALIETALVLNEWFAPPH